MLMSLLNGLIKYVRDISGSIDPTTGQFNLGSDFLVRVALGQVPGYSIINKFGRNDSIPNGSIAPVCIGGNYRTPTVPVSLELVAGANDTSSGSGARLIEIQGLDANYDYQTQTVVPTGATPAAIPGTWTRVFRVIVKESGTYATQSVSSHAGSLIIRESGAGDQWVEIDSAQTGFGVGQSQIGAYTIPTGFTGILTGKVFSVEASATKSGRVYFFTRENVDQVSAPFSGMMLKEQHDGVTGVNTIDPDAPLLVLPEKTDLGFMAYGDGGVISCSVDFQVLLIDNLYL